MSSRKHAWWMGIGVSLIAVPVLYVLSLGPLVWCLSHNRRPAWMNDTFVDQYARPSNWIAEHSPKPVSDVIVAYIKLWQ